MSLDFGHWVIPFDVIDTDYENYALIHSCSHWSFTGIGRWQYIWLLVREPFDTGTEISNQEDQRGRMKMNEKFGRRLGPKYTSEDFLYRTKQGSQSCPAQKEI